jgi:hypothetical protein
MLHSKKSVERLQVFVRGLCRRDLSNAVVRSIEQFHVIKSKSSQSEYKYGTKKIRLISFNIFQRITYSIPTPLYVFELIIEQSRIYPPVIIGIASW